jgi:hypothetical protein
MAHHFWIFATGAVAAGAIAGLANRGILHKGAVAVTTGAMAAADAVNAETQSIVDDANDCRAEARRQAKIDAEVKERMAEIEPEILEKAIKKVDSAAPEK